MALWAQSWRSSSTTAWFCLTRRGLSIAGVITFGSPRIGGILWNNEVKDAGINDLYELWVNDKDIVPRLPPVLSIGIWLHVGAFHFIDWESRVARFYGSDWHRFNDLLYTSPSLDDHSLINYSHRIYQLMPNHDRELVRSSIVGPLSIRETISQILKVTRAEQENRQTALSNVMFQKSLDRNITSVRDLAILYI